MMSLPVERVYRKIIQAGRLAERLGAKLLGLGAYTSVVGDAGVTIARHLSIPVTTGDSYTVAVALEAVREGARQMDIEMERAAAAVVGATGAIGRAAAHILAGEVQELILIGRDASKIESLLESLRPVSHARLAGSTRLDDVSRADLVLTVSSAIGAIIEPHHLRSGAVVCDIARPRDVSARVAQARDDVLVMDGGVVQVPGDVDFGFDFGFPPRTAYACMAEVMILALEGRLESYTLGRNITVEQVQTIARLGQQHGFRLAGLRAFDRPLTEEQIARVRARRRQSQLSVTGLSFGGGSA
jgi:predicted amino acid dehydrogenase